jgi:hypothetical protein
MGALGLGAFAEDEAEEHVEAADAEEEESCNESKVVDMVEVRGRKQKTSATNST